uniref:Anaphase-promoting complex subunit 1 n=1 Tax=Encephalitozoon cuniculi TaxID=6035 RepID=M1K559_ENCCN|nr:hypothetical protein ECU10_1160 [Encephalitozoon cuniculi]
MVVRWRDAELMFRGRRLRFEEKIIGAGRVKRWVVVCTQSRICFYGDEDMTLTRPIKAAVVKNEGVYYHNKENNHVMLVSNPFEPEEFVFFHRGFVLREVVSGEMVLERTGGYLLRNVGRGRALTQGMTGSSCSDKDDDNFDEINRTRVLTVCKVEEGMRCLVEDYEEEERHECGMNVEIVDYDGFMVGIHGNAASFVRLGSSKGGVKRSKLLSEVNIKLEKEVECLVKYKMRISRGKCLEFLRINDMLFLGNEVVCPSIEESLWPGSRVSRAWMCDYSRPFWMGMSEVEKNLLSCYPRAMQKVFMGMFLRSKEKRFDVLEPTREVVDRINRTLEEWLARCRSVWEFLSLEIPQIEGLRTVERCRELVSYTYPFLTGINDVMKVKYRRIMRCNLDAIGNLKYPDIMNLGYRVIYMETKKNEVLRSTRPVRSIRRLCKITERHFGDPRMEEVFSLFDESPRVFEIDEYDLENKKEKGYVLRMASNIGRAYLFYGSGVSKDRYGSKQLKFPIHKNGELSEIEIKENGWTDWPIFNHSVFRGCGLSPYDEMSHDFIESRILDFISTGAGSEFEVAGKVFSFGLQGRLLGLHPQKLAQLVSPKHPVISMALLAGMGISYIGKRDDPLGRMYLHYLKSGQPLYIHVGCIVGLGMLYAGSGNVLIKDVLTVEANRKGVFWNEQYNRGNKIWYDYTYRVMASFSISMLYMKTSPEMFRFIELKDSLCELLTNGIVLFGSKQTRFLNRFRRSDANRPEEVLYSELFSLGISMDERLDSIVEDVKRRVHSAGLYELYRLSGKILYVAVYLLYREEVVDLEGALFKAILEVCLLAERAMKDNHESKVLFDVSLMSLSLISNSSCNIDVIRILRRQIKMTETGRFLSEQTDFFFTSSRCKQETQLSMRYGDIERYKLCLGIVTCGMGTLKISTSFHLVLDIVSTLFIHFPISPVDQEYFNMVRYFLLLSMRENPSGFKSTMRYLRQGNKGSRRRLRADMSNINKIFLKEYSAASDVDKKFVIDVLTDFYEQHGDKDNLLDIEMLKNIACRTP